MFLYGQWQHCLRGTGRGAGGCFERGMRTTGIFVNFGESKCECVVVAFHCFYLFRNVYTNLISLSLSIHPSFFQILREGPPTPCPEAHIEASHACRIRILSTARRWSSQCLGFKDLLCRSNQRDRDKERE